MLIYIYGLVYSILLLCLSLMALAELIESLRVNLLKLHLQNKTQSKIGLAFDHRKKPYELQKDLLHRNSHRLSVPLAVQADITPNPNNSYLLITGNDHENPINTTFDNNGTIRIELGRLLNYGVLNNNSGAKIEYYNIDALINQPSDTLKIMASFMTATVIQATSGFSTKAH